MEDLLQLQLLARQQRTPYAVATIVEATGSTPRGRRARCSSMRTAAAPGPSAADIAELRAKKKTPRRPSAAGKTALVRYEVVPQGGGRPGWPAAARCRCSSKCTGTRSRCSSSAAAGTWARACCARRSSRGSSCGSFDDRPAGGRSRRRSALADRFFPVAGMIFTRGIAGAGGPGRGVLS